MRIGHTTVVKQSFDVFQDAKNMFPALRPDYFSKSISDITYFIAVVSLFEKAKSTQWAGEVRSSDDWKWKQMFYPGQIYLKDVVYGNLGFTDEELQSYYKTHREQYKKIISLPADTGAKDTLQKAKAKAARKDSVAYLPFPEVKDKIVETMFLSKYPAPDSLFRKDPKDTTRIDSAAVQSQWIFSMKRGAVDFFMKQAFKEKFNKPYSDSLNEWYGEGKPITPKDMKVILSWLPEEQRGYYSTPNGTRDMAKWLLRWKLFSEKTDKIGSSYQANIKTILDWAWKINLAYYYVDHALTPSIKKSLTVDSAMCAYVYWDEHMNPLAKPDSFGLARIIDMYRDKEANIKIDSQIYEMRKNLKVTVLQSDFVDDMAGNPAQLIAHADSLRDTGNTSESQRIYEALSRGFLFTPEGMRSLIELAKIMTEQQQYTQAIKNYRDYLVLSHDVSKRCNTFFMIGFIYDEYLNRSEDARVNYRWVLKNTPDCELTDDAEFMSLHLGEAMNSVEELRAEAMRQGKKVDTSSIPEQSTDTALKKAGN